MLRLVALVRTDVSEELSASFLSVTRIGELGTTLAVTSNRRMQRRFLQAPHGVTYQKTPFCIVTAVRTSNLSYNNCLRTTAPSRPVDPKPSRDANNRYTDLWNKVRSGNLHNIVSRIPRGLSFCLLRSFKAGVKTALLQETQRVLNKQNKADTATAEQCTISN
jgi:hypothetical protein